MVNKERNALMLVLYELLYSDGYILSPDYMQFKSALDTTNATFDIIDHEEEDIGGRFVVSLLRLPDDR